MENQLTFRISHEIARAIARRARERGVPKSQVVREALRVYLALELARPPRNVGERLERYRGIVSLQPVAPAPEERERRDRAVPAAVRVLGRLSEGDARALDEAVTALRARWR